MKKLKIYKGNDEFVIERVNEFNHGTKRFFVSKEGLLEGIEAYKDVLDQYELQVTDELWPEVLNFLNDKKMSGHGGRREGAGRPSVGTTRRVALTMPDDLWEKTDKCREDWGTTQSQTIRVMIESYFDKQEG